MSSNRAPVVVAGLLLALAWSTGAMGQVSKGDRVYTGDQTSNTVSVIDPATNTLLGVIRLGDPVPVALSALYRGELLVHGLGFSPDGRTLAVISIGSNSVTFVDTTTNRVKGRVYLGRSPHEGFFTPDGRELWVAVRGEDYISVIDSARMREVRRIKTANGPAMILFRPDGRYAFVPSSFSPELSVIDTKSYRVVARVPQASPFSPNLAVSRDGKEVWFTLKDTGKVQVVTGEPPFRVVTTLDTGPITNHVALVENANGKFAYVTVGGLNEVKVFRRGPQPELVATIPTGDLPHGIWRSGNDGRVYVGLENGDAVVAIDTLSNTVLATIPVGQTPQALVYVPGAVATGDGTAGLTPLGESGRALHVEMGPPAGVPAAARATVAVNSLGVIDLLQLAVAGLEPGGQYELWLVDSHNGPKAARTALATFKANASGAAVVQVIGPLRTVAEQESRVEGEPAEHRILTLTVVGSGQTVLEQLAP